MKNLLIAILFPIVAQAQTLEQMCPLIADVALVSRTLAKHQISRDKATAMLADIYNMPDDASKKIVGLLTDLAYKHDLEPRMFAVMVNRSCMNGHLGKILGVEL